jgi:hypothetical protein
MTPVVYPVFTIGDDVTVIGHGCWEGLQQGIVLRETGLRVLNSDDAGFLHWFTLDDVVHMRGPSW